MSAAFTHLVQRFGGMGARPRLCGRATSPDDQPVDFVFPCLRPACRRVFVGEYGLSAGDRYELHAVAAPAFDEAHAGPWR
jgi:hypothetical protein